ncbi:MAG: hypothetical protein Fur0018_25830 [Anaerolineales bacterium]
MKCIDSLPRWLLLTLSFSLACNLPFLRPVGSVLPVAETLPPPFLPSTGAPTAPQASPTAARIPTLDPANNLLPDSEIVDSPAGLNFDLLAFIQASGGWFTQAEQYLPSTGRTPAPQVLVRVALENSINPRLLAALLDFECGCVFSQPTQKLDRDYLLGVRDEAYQGIYRQLSWAVEQLSDAFYARAFGSPTLSLSPPNPNWNPGSVALWYYFARHAAQQGHSSAQAEADLAAFLAAYTTRFGDPWARAIPLLPPATQQPVLTLPFPSPAEHPWALTGGPHPPWTRHGPWAALDFAPTLRGAEACDTSPDWVLAPAAGRVVRSANGALLLDLDFDGREQTGWTLLFMHLAENGRLPIGTDVKPGTRLGHPSCEGGPASGAHVHIARKYNGMWIPADGSLPFSLGAWRAHFGDKAYQGRLTNGDRTVTASPYGARSSVLP